ncbi:MAG: family hydrolase [Ferruginibacter sp.]|nr:family hydrolase [Ferruginibacter sp.]
MLELVKFSKGSAAYFAGMAVLAPWLVAMKVGVITNTAAKEKLLSHFFSGMPIEKFDQLCQSFTKTKLPSLIRPEAQAALNNHRKNGDEIVVVSASAQNWVSPWCIEQGIPYLCSKLVVKNGLLTGKLDGPNCNAAEKVNRIVQVYNPADYVNIFCYGDSSGDKEMIALATKPFFRKFP